RRVYWKTGPSASSSSRPEDLQFVDLAGRSDSKELTPLICGAVAVSAAQLEYLRPAAGAQSQPGADGIAIAADSVQLDGQRIAGRIGIVLQQRDGSVLVNNSKVRPPVAIPVEAGHPASQVLTAKEAPAEASDVLKTSTPAVVEQLRRHLPG